MRNALSRTPIGEGGEHGELTAHRGAGAGGSALRRQLRTFGSLTAAGQVESVLSFATTATLVRLSGTAETGKVLLAQSMASVWFLVWDPRFEDAQQRFVPLEQHRGSGHDLVVSSASPLGRGGRTADHGRGCGHGTGGLSRWMDRRRTTLAARAGRTGVGASTPSGAHRPVWRSLTGSRGSERSAPGCCLRMSGDVDRIVDRRHGWLPGRLCDHQSGFHGGAHGCRLSGGPPGMWCTGRRLCSHATGVAAVPDEEFGDHIGLPGLGQWHFPPGRTARRPQPGDLPESRRAPGRFFAGFVNPVRHSSTRASHGQEPRDASVR